MLQCIWLCIFVGWLVNVLQGRHWYCWLGWGWGWRGYHRTEAVSEETVWTGSVAFLFIILAQSDVMKCLSMFKLCFSCLTRVKGEGTTFLSFHSLKTIWTNFTGNSTGLGHTAWMAFGRILLYKPISVISSPSNFRNWNSKETVEVTVQTEASVTLSKAFDFKSKVFRLVG